MRIVSAVYFLLLFVLSIFSYGFVDFSLPVSVPFNFNHLIFDARLESLAIYTSIIFCLFLCYGCFIWLAYKKKIFLSQIKNIIFITVAVLLISYPAFSNDIFNYIATAKVTFFYRENPYIVMPIELSNEPMLAYLHGANKTALYGPSWILLTFIPYLAGMGNLIQSIVMFKLFTMLFYLLTIYLLWKLSRNITSVVIFSLNPLVIIESLISSHNDIVMIFFALAGFYFLKKRYLLFPFLSLLISIGIKFATVVLLPVFLFVWYQQRVGKKVNWTNVWFISGTLLVLVFLLSPLREEMYPWYFQWVLVFIALVPQYYALLVISIGLSLGLSLRFAPYIYTRNWNDPVPFIKLLVTFVSSVLFFTIYLFRKLYLSMVYKKSRTV